MPFTTIVSTETLHRHLDNPAWVVADCRSRLDDPKAGRQLYLEAHIPGAIYADLNRDLAGPPGGDAGRHPLPDLDVFRARLGNWGIGEGVQVVCYDDAGGAYAARLWWMLRYLGHDSVAVLDGGWPAWLAHGYPTASGEEITSPVTFVGDPHPAMIASLEEVAALSEGGGLLVDSRDPARYRGEVEPIDRVAGHIPGAWNRPFARNLAPDGTLRPAPKLAEEWKAVLGQEDATEAVVYCGSGVTACHNLLSLEVAGLPGARLFVPSWSGWSANVERPIATGEET
jgi:thiosulfate/3-mercaptopyruvate sulfurtransferase